MYRDLGDGGVGWLGPALTLVEPFASTKITKREMNDRKKRDERMIICFFSIRIK